jgi:hypothetical protein
MRPIPLKLREQMEQDPIMRMCCHSDEDDSCDCEDEWGKHPGRAEWEHCFIYAGKQINEWWAIIGCCWYHHRGPGLNKDLNKWFAIKRMTEKDLVEAQKKYPKFNWTAERDRLKRKFGW